MEKTVLAAGEQLEALPARDRPLAGALIDREHLLPSTAIEILTNLAGMEPQWRRDLLKMARSSDESVRIKALTTAAKLPAPPRFPPPPPARRRPHHPGARAGS